MSVDVAIEKIRHYFNINLLDRDREKLKSILNDVDPRVEVKVVKEKVYVHKKPKVDIDLVDLAVSICKKYELPYKFFMARSRKVKVVACRKEFMQAAHLDYGVPMNQIAKFLSINHATVIYHINDKFAERKHKAYLKKKNQS